MITWIYGNTGAGKTALLRQMKDCVQLDADDIRDALDFTDMSEEGRRKFNLMMAGLADVLASQGHDVAVATICPYRDQRKDIEEWIGCRFIYVGYAGDDDLKSSPFERP